MESTTQIILSALGLIGIGGIITGFLTKQKELDFKRLEQNQKRFKSILLFMDVVLFPERIKYLTSIHPNVKSQKDVLAWLEAEFIDMILYASRETVFAVKEFIENPTREHYYSAVVAMRKDLWDKNTRFRGRDLIVNLKEPRDEHLSNRP